MKTTLIDATRSAFETNISGPTIAELIEAGKLEKPSDPPAEIGWYGCKEKPVRPGVFRTRVPGLGAGFSYFSGEEWGNQARDADQAAEWWGLYGASGVQAKEWCGLAEPAH